MVWRAYFSLEEMETLSACDQGTLWNSETNECEIIQESTFGGLISVSEQEAFTKSSSVLVLQ